MWTGWDDPDLTEKGKEEAKNTGESLADIHFDFAYTMALKRAKKTLDIIKLVLGREDLPTTVSKSLNERNYGIYTKRNKWEVKKEVGEEEFKKIRRGWNHNIPDGETLKQVYEREIPYFQSNILPQLKAGKNVIVCSSGNATRALAKYLENILDHDISNFEIKTGEALVYEIDGEGKVVHKESRSKNENTGMQ